MKTRNSIKHLLGASLAFTILLMAGAANAGELTPAQQKQCEQASKACQMSGTGCNIPSFCNNPGQ